MPSTVLKIGPFAGVYIGDYGDTGALTQLLEISTGPGILKDNIPEQYEAVVDNTVQAGRRKITFGLSFYGDDDIITNLARRPLYFLYSSFGRFYFFYLYVIISSSRRYSYFFYSYS